MPVVSATTSQLRVRETVRLSLLRALAPLLRGSEPSRSPPANPRILIVRPDHLGDLILAGPLGVALRKGFPAAKVDWLVGPWGEEVIGRCADPSDVLICEFPGFTRRPKGVIWEPYAELRRQASRLRGARYDIAIISRPDHWWGAMLAADARIPVRIGYDVPECRPFLTSGLPPRSSRHVVDEGFALGRLAARLIDPTVRLSPPAVKFRIDESERIWANAAIAAWGIDRSPLVAIHPGSGSPIKAWQAERWGDVANRLHREAGARIAITGSRAEDALVCRAAKSAHPPMLRVGPTTLGQLAALFERCALVLGSDSGPLHLAAAVGASTARLYGPTDPSRFGPVGEPARQRVISASLPCQPCGNVVAPPCGAVQTPPCLLALGADIVAKTSLDLLKSPRC